MTSEDSSSIEVKQIKLDNKIDRANAGIAVIIQQLAKAFTNCPEPNEAVAELVSTVSPDLISEETNNEQLQHSLSSEEIKLICDQVTEIFHDLSSFRTELNSLNDEFIKLQQKHSEDIKQINVKFEDDLNKAKLQYRKEINSLNEKQNLQDQYLRSNNLVFADLDLPQYNCSGAAFAHYIAQQINNFLPMLHIPVNEFNINIAHPLKSKVKGKSLVIVRFTNRHIRNDIYENREYLRYHGITVTEHLTPENVKILHKAQEIVGKSNAWSFNGKLFAFNQNRTIQIKNMDDICNLKESVNGNDNNNVRKENNNYYNSYPRIQESYYRGGRMLYGNHGFHGPTNTRTRGYPRGYTNNRNFYNNVRRTNAPSFSQAVTNSN